MTHGVHRFLPIVETIADDARGQVGGDQGSEGDGMTWQHAPVVESMTHSYTTAYDFGQPRI